MSRREKKKHKAKIANSSLRQHCTTISIANSSKWIVAGFQIPVVDSVSTVMLCCLNSEYCVVPERGTAAMHKTLWLLNQHCINIQHERNRDGTSISHHWNPISHHWINHVLLYCMFDATVYLEETITKWRALTFMEASHVNWPMNILHFPFVFSGTFYQCLVIR